MPELNAFGQPVGDLVPAWGPRPPAVAVRLEGRYVALEPLAVSHAPALFAALCDEASRELWTYRPVAGPGQLRRARASAVVPE